MAFLDRVNPLRVWSTDGVPSAPVGDVADVRRSLIDRIFDEIRGGLQNEKRERLDDARINDDFYHGRFDAYTSPWRNVLDPRAVRTLPVVRTVANHLAAHLYRSSPERTIKGFEPAAEWLEVLYRRNQMDAKWQEADRITTVTDLAAFEVRGMSGPGSDRRPVAVDLWAGDQVVAWLDPDDVMSPIAVATLDRYDHQRRCRLWTADYRYTFLTKKWQGPGHPEGTAGGTAYFLTATEDNPYRGPDGAGIIPFAFVHYHYPATYFHSGGPGSGLRKANDHVNYRLSKMADDVLNWRLIGVIRNARADWNFPRGMKAGQWAQIPSALIDAAGAAIPAEAEYLAPPLDHLRHDREELNAWLDTTLQMEGLPSAAWRLEQTGTMSGVAIVAEQLPLVLRARQRQRPFTAYEQDLARMILRVATAHARDNGVDSLPLGEAEGRVDDLEAAAMDGELHVRFAEPSEELPGPNRDASDAFQLESRLTSRTQLLMKRESLDRDQAEARMVQVGEDLARETLDFAEADRLAAGGAFGNTAIAAPELAGGGVPTTVAIAGAGEPSENGQPQDLEDSGG